MSEVCFLHFNLISLYNSRASNIAFLLDIAQMSDLDFGLIQQNISIKKGFIPILRAPSFF